MSKGRKNRNAAPARMHVLLASKSPVALIIRRRPAKMACTFMWDRDTDTFTPGECVMKIYERHADLSPNGKYLWYLARNPRGYWQAVSRAPSLKKMILYRNEDFRDADIPSTTTAFVDELHRQFCATRPYHRRNPNHGFPLFDLRQFNEQPWDVCGTTSIYYRRLIRDGWKLVNHEDSGEKKEDRLSQTVFEKPIAKAWVLRKHAFCSYRQSENHGDGHWDEHAIVNTRTGECLEQKQWDWAETEQSGLLWTEKGRLFRLNISAKNYSAQIDTNAAKLLCDFNAASVTRSHLPYSLNGSSDVLKGLRAEQRLDFDTDYVRSSYLKAIKSGNIDACFYLSRFYVKNKQYAKAKFFIEKGLERVKQRDLITYWHYCDYGNLLLEMRDFDNAQTAFNKSLTLTNASQNKANSFNNLGVVQLRQKSYENALDCFQKALEQGGTEQNCRLFQDNYELAQRRLHKS